MIFDNDSFRQEKRLDFAYHVALLSWRLRYVMEI